MTHFSECAWSVPRGDEIGDLVQWLNVSISTPYFLAMADANFVSCRTSLNFDMVPIISPRGNVLWVGHWRCLPLPCYGTGYPKHDTSSQTFSYMLGWPLQTRACWRISHSPASALRVWQSVISPRRWPAKDLYEKDRKKRKAPKYRNSADLWARRPRVPRSKANQGDQVSRVQSSLQRKC